MAAKAPAGLGANARRLWTNIAGTYELRADELRILEDACREADLIDLMQSEIDQPGHETVVKGSMGQPVASPLVQEVRQHRQVLKSLLVTLKLPDEGSAESGDPRAVQAREAASARWSRGA